MKIYLDNAGTKKPDEKITEEYFSLIKKTYGNSSSLHSQRNVKDFGKMSRKNRSYFFN